jgi:hypothetical protein
MNRVALVISVIVVGVAGTSFLFSPSVMSARAATYVDARVLTLAGDPFPEPPGASEFCRQVYQGTHPDVTILLTLATREELVGAPIEDFYTVTDGVGVLPIRNCFDEDVSNDPEGVVSSLDVALALLLDRQWDAGGIGWTIAGYDNGCPPNWDGKTVDENSPGWWQGEQDYFQAALLAGIAANDPGLSLEEGSLQWWAPRVEAGPDVTSMDLPAWMRNLIIPFCELSPEELEAARAGLDRPSPESELSPDEEITDEERLTLIAAEYVAGETQAMYAWIEQKAPGISLEEAGQRWVDANAAGWGDDSLVAPWGICASDWMAPDSLSSAGISLPEWISSRIIGYGDGPDCN